MYRSAIRCRNRVCFDLSRMKDYTYTGDTGRNKYQAVEVAVERMEVGLLSV